MEGSELIQLGANTQHQGATNSPSLPLGTGTAQHGERAGGNRHKLKQGIQTG